MRKFKAQYEVDFEKLQIVFRAPSENMVEAKANFEEYLKAEEEMYCK